MDARRVLYCCSVGRASFVTIRHIPFRFRTARSTYNNNKERALWELDMDKMAEGPGPPPRIYPLLGDPIQQTRSVVLYTAVHIYTIASIVFVVFVVVFSPISFLFLQSVGHGQKSMSAVLYTRCLRWASAGSTNTRRFKKKKKKKEKEVVVVPPIKEVAFLLCVASSNKYKGR